MLTRSRLLLLGLGAVALGCDALPKLQLQLQQGLQHEFHITSALVMVIDTTTMVVAIFDDARAALELKERAAFEEQVAYYAVRHYEKSRLKSVGVLVGRASRRRAGNDPDPTVFLPEYHPDGTVRLALMPSRRALTAPVEVQRKQ
jgi:hypothetical protein